MATNPVNIDIWIKENKQFFKPPVCNKLLHNEQLKIFVVGGPNTRNDYHLEEGEEFFYMIKGDMCLKIIQNGQIKDIHIKEGEVFLLPPRVPHSPQRFENTFGLVVERERRPFEMDALRYYVDGASSVLFERWFHCHDLGTQLAPIIKEFFDSEEYKTGIPGKDSVSPNPPFEPNNTHCYSDPFRLKEWIEHRRDKLNELGSLPLFSGNFSSKIFVYGRGVHTIEALDIDTFVWQF
ncbi:3-hydroxyanthranilate 3:4-dioxygenase-like protein, partial [Dinothrombium tinctorium]